MQTEASSTRCGSPQGEPLRKHKTEKCTLLSVRACYRMAWSMRDTVRYAAKLAVYDEHTMSVKSHQLPMTIRRATEPTMPSPPAKRCAAHGGHRSKSEHGYL